MLARGHAVEADRPLRLSLLAALALQNRAAELIVVAESTLARSPQLRLSDQSLVLAQESWARTLSGDLRRGEAAGRRALDAAERACDAAMTVWALTTTSVAVKRQGRYAEALAYARRAVALTSDPTTASPLPLQPKFFLGLALCDSDLQAAREKSNQLLVSQSLAYRAVIATAKGDLRSAEELIVPLAVTIEADAGSYGAAFIAYAVSGLSEAKGDSKGAYEVLCGPGASTPRARTATTTAVLHRISSASPSPSAAMMSPTRWPVARSREPGWRPRFRQSVAWRCGAGVWSTTRLSP